MSVDRGGVSEPASLSEYAAALERAAAPTRLSRGRGLYDPGPITQRIVTTQQCRAQRVPRLARPPCQAGRYREPMATSRGDRNLGPAVQRAARSNPAMSAVALAARLGCHPDTVRRHLRGTPRTAHQRRGGRPLRPPAQFEPIEQQPDTIATARRYVADPDGEQWLLDAMRSDPEGLRPGMSLVAEVLLTDPSCPPIMVSAITEAGSSLLRERAAEHPNCRRELLNRLSNDFTTEVRVAAAANPCNPTATINDYADDASPVKRAAAAAYRRCPPKVLTRLATDPHPAVRAAVASNRNSPPALLTRFAQDPDTDVRIAAGKNLNLPTAAAARLAADQLGGVRGSVDHRRDLPAAARRLAMADRQFITEAGQRISDILQALADDPH